MEYNLNQLLDYYNNNKIIYFQFYIPKNNININNYIVIQKIIKLLDDDKYIISIKNDINNFDDKYPIIILDDIINHFEYKNKTNIIIPFISNI